jgi:hypothetical protein
VGHRCSKRFVLRLAGRWRLTPSVAGRAIRKINWGAGWRRNQTSHWSNSSSSASTYYLRSSVLGGQIVEEINGNDGTRTAGYVIGAGGELLATQLTGGEVDWTHVAAGGTGEYNTSTITTGATRTELDPLGAVVPTTAPESSAPEEPANIDGGHFAGLQSAMFGDIFNTSAGCTEDGFRVSCSQALQEVNSGIATLLPPGVSACQRA